MRKLYNKLLVIMVMMLAFVAFCGYSDKHKKVYDEAEIYSEAEVKALEELAKTKGESVKLDLVIFTEDTIDVPDPMVAADDFYDENNFGYDDCDGSGAVLYINMYTRKLWLSCAGLAQAYVDEDTENEILDDIQECMMDDDYYEAAVAYINGVTNAAIKFQNNSEYDELLDNWYSGEYDTYDDIADIVFKPETVFTKFKNPLLSIGIGVGLGLIVILIMVVSQKSSSGANERTYLKKGSLNFPISNDNFVRTATTSRVIQSSSSGGGGGHSHHSSSGRSHSGGGRSF